MSVNTGSGGPPGRPPNQGVHDQGLHHVSGQDSVTSKGLGDSTGDRKEMRTFAEILADENRNRNILEVKLRKLSNSDQVPVKSLTMEDISELLFDVIKLDPSHCLGVALKI